MKLFKKKELSKEQKEQEQFSRESLTKVYIRRFKKHTLGKVGLVILAILYFCALFASFLSTHDAPWGDKTKSYHPPSKIHFMYEDPATGKKSLRPYTDELYITDVMRKTYGAIPQQSLRFVTIEDQVGRNDQRGLTTKKTAASRERELMRQLRMVYRFKKSDECYGQIKQVIRNLEAAPESDLSWKVDLGTITYANGETVHINFWLSKGNKNFLSLFYAGSPYKMWGIIPGNRHLIGSATGGVYFWGGDSLGRDLYSRMLFGSQISLSVGLLGVAVSFFMGLLLGGVAGYFGGLVDTLIMRFTEVLLAFPSLYLLLTLRASLPKGLSSIQIYLIIVFITSFIGWGGLARNIRGQVLSLKNEDYVLSARTMGLSDGAIIRRHILPNTMSFVIVNLTLSIPGYILGESALSLLNLGITEPSTSWGLLLSVARKQRVVNDFPWVLIPGFAIFLAILAWNFFGDALRDAVDPKSRH